MKQIPAHINPERLEKLLSDMVDIYSPSGKEAEIADYLEDYLKEAGLPVIRQNVEDDRDNLLVIAPGDNAQAVFMGHIDTVAAPDYLNYRFYREGDDIYGLGTADMKGGCAAMIEAFTAYSSAHNGKIPASLALVVGEEETGDGAQTFVNEYHYPWAVIGEPTGLIPCFSHYGYLEAELITYGKRMHASLAHKDHNAIRTMLTMLLEITQYMDNSRQEVIYNIRDMQSSQAGFVVPDRCSLFIDFHVPPQFGIGELSYEIEEIVSAQLKNGILLQDSLIFSTIHSGYDIPQKGAFHELIKNAAAELEMEWKPSFFRSDSDASILWGAGIKPVILGPGELTMAHTSDESASFSEVEKSSRLYYNILKALGNK